MIELKNASKSFGNNTLFTIEEAVFPNRGLVVIKGENGCGKTTLFNILSLLDLDYEGEVLIDGKDFQKEKSDARARFIRDRIAYVFQKQNMISFLSVEENRNLGLKKTPSGRTEVHTLSQGQQENAILQSILNQDKSIYLLDEVLSSLDSSNRAKTIAKIQQLAQKALVILVSHDVSLDEIADQVYLMEDKTLKLIKNNINNDEKKIGNTISKATDICFKHLCFAHVKSKLLSMCFHLVTCSLILFFVLLGGCSDLNDSFFSLVNGIRNNGYVLVEGNHTTTSDEIVKTFPNDSYYVLEDQPLIVASTTPRQDDNNLYCNQKFYDEVCDREMWSGAPVHDYRYETSTVSKNIVIDNSIKTNMFICYQPETEDCSYDRVYEDNLKYNSDQSRSEGKNGTSGSVCFAGESYLKKNYPSFSSLSFQEDTFYTNNKSYISSTHVSSFYKPIYRRMSDKYIVDYNQIFPNGVDTVLLDGFEPSEKNTYIFISDAKLAEIGKLYLSNTNICLDTRQNAFFKAAYIAHKKLNPQSEAFLDGKYTISEEIGFYCENFYDDYQGVYSYNVMLIFFAIIFLFTEAVLYQYRLRENHHDSILLFSKGLERRKVYFMSILPSLFVHFLSYPIAGILLLVQTGFLSSFVSGFPLAVLLTLAFVLVSLLLFGKEFRHYE